MSGAIASKSGESVRWWVKDGHVYIDHRRYKKSPMKLLPGKSDEGNALHLLGELEREIELGIARPK